jgi:hypothetical protein
MTRISNAAAMPRGVNQGVDGKAFTKGVHSRQPTWEET